MLAPTAFVADMVQEGVLQFGEFTLKSGLKSPYFFNLGKISSGPALSRLGYVYAKRIAELNLRPDVLFGPAYKGIPIATATAMSLSNMSLNVDIAFNRKEAKDHGEGGNLVGVAMGTKRVLIIDDVVTDGASKIEAFEMIRANQGKPIAVLIALDRRERDETGDRTMLEALETKLQTPVYSVATLDDILAYLDYSGMDKEKAAVSSYADNHCIVN